MRYIIGIFAGLFLSSCAHHTRDVRPSADGVHKVVVTATDEESGSREAMAQAEAFCDKSKKQFAIVKESKKYTGDMSEENYKTTKKIGKAAKVIGGAAMVFGGARESNAGGVVGLGGVTAEAVAGKGYTVEMSFKCI